MLLIATKYMEYKSRVIGDFKMVCFLTGCPWHTSDNAAHYLRNIGLNILSKK